MFRLHALSLIFIEWVDVLSSSGIGREPDLRLIVLQEMSQSRRFAILYKGLLNLQSMEVLGNALAKNWKERQTLFDAPLKNGKTNINLIVKILSMDTLYESEKCNTLLTAASKFIFTHH